MTSRGARSGGWGECSGEDEGEEGEGGIGGKVFSGLLDKGGRAVRVVEVMVMGRSLTFSSWASRAKRRRGGGEEEVAELVEGVGEEGSWLALVRTERQGWARN